MKYKMLIFVGWLCGLVVLSPARRSIEVGVEDAITSLKMEEEANTPSSPEPEMNNNYFLDYAPVSTHPPHNNPLPHSPPS